jgi:hypothetical protein
MSAFGGKADIDHPLFKCREASFHYLLWKRGRFLHHASSPPLANINPGKPAPTIGAGVFVELERPTGHL